MRYFRVSYMIKGNPYRYYVTEGTPTVWWWYAKRISAATLGARLALLNRSGIHDIRIREVPDNS